jgi:putative transposase
MKSQTPKTQVNKAKWLTLIQECRSSGLTVLDWCQQKGISDSTYYYWLSRFRKEAVADFPRMGHHKLSQEDEINVTALPCPSSVSSDDSNTLITAPAVIHLGSATIELHNNAAPTLITAILKAVAKC